MPHYAAQKDGAACGIASLTMLMNAARANQKLTSEDLLVTQQSLLDRVKINYRWGLTLEQLGEAARSALKSYGLNAVVQVIHAEDTAQFENRLLEILIQNEKTDQDFILANFDQSVFTGDEKSFGHISPVMAYDRIRLEVLIADVDRESYEPYWVSLKNLKKGITTKDPISGKMRGIVLISLNSTQNLSAQNRSSL